MSNLDNQNSRLSTKIDKVVDSKTNANGSVLYKVRWVSFSWVPEEYLASSEALIKSFLAKKQEEISACPSGAKERKNGSQKDDHDVQNQIPTNNNPIYDTSTVTSGAKKRKSYPQRVDCDFQNQSYSQVDNYDVHNKVATNGYSINALTLQIKELQKKLDTECKNRSDLVQILSKLLLTEEKKEIQTQKNIEAIQVNREAIKNLEAVQLSNKDKGDQAPALINVSTQTVMDISTQTVMDNYTQTEGNDQESLFSNSNSDRRSIFMPNMQDVNEDQHHTEDVDIEVISNMGRDPGGTNVEDLQTNNGRSTRTKRSLISNRNPIKSSKASTDSLRSVENSNSTLEQSIDIFEKDNILQLPGPVVNTRTALEFSVKDVKTEEDFCRHAVQVSPDYGRLVSYRCKSDKGTGGLLQCFIKKSPNELEGHHSYFYMQQYTENYFMKVHWSVSLAMQESLRDLGHFPNDFPGLEVEPVIPEPPKRVRTNQDILKAILYSQGPIVTKNTCREGFKNFKPPITMVQFIHHVKLLSPDYGQNVRYGTQYNKILECFIKKHPDEVTKKDIDLHRYSQRYFASINSCITPLMQIGLKEHGFISAELIARSQQLLSEKINKDSNKLDELNDESILNDSEDVTGGPLPAEPNEDVIRCILNAQGPVVSFKCLYTTFKKVMKGVKAEDFHAHARLLTPDYGQLVSCRCARFRGKARNMKFFIKKPPTELSGTDLDLKRYSKKYYASLHAALTPAMILALKSLGHISEDICSRTIFSPMIQQEAAAAEKEQVRVSLNESNLEEANIDEEEELLQAVAQCYDV